MGLLAAGLALAAALLLLAPAPGPRPSPSVVPRPGSTSAPGPARWRTVAVAGAVTSATLLVPGVAALPAAAVAGVLVWRSSGHWESAAVRRRRDRLEADLPHLVDLLVAALRAGADPGRALGQVADVVGGPAAEELRVPVGRLALGADPLSVWADLAEHPQLGRLGRTLERSARSGAPVVAALQRLALDLRGRRRAEVAARVRQVEVKAAVPLGACLLPSFVLLGVVPLVAGSALGFLLPA